MIEQELATIASTVKDMYVSFPFIGKKEKERKQLSTQLQSIERSHKTAAQASPMVVYTPHQPTQSLYKNLSITLASPFLSKPPSQNFQPLATIHPDYKSTREYMTNPKQTMD